jgi:succinyl-diaminopimelate desuccinylase
MQALELTRELLRFNTINPPGDERDCAHHLGRLLENAQFTVVYHEFADKRTSLIARVGEMVDPKPLCFTGHIDTVPLGTMPWVADAFTGDIDDGRLYGRGASDMKGGVAAFVVAACRLAPKLHARPGIMLVITAGEETACQGANYLAARPDALGTAGAIVVAEPTSNVPCIGHKGALWLRGRTSGITAHGSMPECGVNAIYKAARAVTKLEQFRFETATHPVLGGPTLNVSTIRGGLNINSVPDATEIGVDIRTIPEQKHTALIERLTQVLGDEVKLDTITDVESVWTEVNHPWIQQTFELAERITGWRRTVRAAPYFTDASALKGAMGNAPTVILGPGEMEKAHQTDEYCIIERIEQAVELFTEIARRWTGA